MRKFVAMAALCLNAFGQDSDPTVSISGGPPGKAWSVLYFYTVIGGADYPEYICSATATQPATAAPVTQIVDAANVGTVTTTTDHGLAINGRVVIAGVTGDTDLNGTYIVQTVPSATTFTIATANVSDATYATSGITHSSSAPRSNQSIWSIKKFFYGGTGGTSIMAIRWAVKAGNVIASTGTDHSCDARTTLAYQ